MNTQSKTSTLHMILVGLFAAIIYLGIQFFRIPLPAAVGAPFLHFGNIFFLLSVLLLGSKKGALSGCIGFILFDVLNGYVMVIPKVAVLTLLMAFAAGTIFNTLNAKGKTLLGVFLATLVAFLISLTGDLIYDTVFMLLAGSGFGAALWAAFTSLLATVINSVFGIIAIMILYVPLRTTLDKFQ